MFNKVLIANRGDQPSLDGAAAKPKSLLVEDHAGDFAAEVQYV
ncbi:hypothetical protein [Methylovorus sp. MM2]|nr:hypothetical protein [Methylovorus sp. MM2]